MVHPNTNSNTNIIQLHTFPTTQVTKSQFLTSIGNTRRELTQLHIALTPKGVQSIKSILTYDHMVICSRITPKHEFNQFYLCGCLTIKEASFHLQIHAGTFIQ